MHDNESNCCRQSSCEPLQSWIGIFLQVELEDGCYDDTNQATEEVAKDQRAWLRERHIDSAIAQDCRSALK